MFDDRRRRRPFRFIGILGGILFIIGIASIFYAPNFLKTDTIEKIPINYGAQQINTDTTVPLQNQNQNFQNTNDNTTSPIASVAQTATPAVVGLSVLKADGGSIFEKNMQEKWNAGSGVIVSQKGYIITNHHVAGGRNKRIIVSLHDGRTIDGVTVWADPVLDLAIVKINLPNLTAIPMGDSNTIQVGQTAIAIGNPLGMQFQRTVTSGIISALNRTIKIDTESGPNFMEDLIQTDASINPGNSGGPLLNLKAQVIGINTIKVSSAEGIGFAVPINMLVGIIRQLEERGEFIDPYLGIFAYDKEVMPYIDANISMDRGIYVVNVDPNGPAARSGIKVGTIITAVDGVEVNTMAQLRTFIYTKKPGQEITLNTGAEGKIKVILSAKDGDGLLTR